MSKEKHPLSQKEFDSIYSKVPRLTVEIIIHSKNGIYLTKRDIEPCKGMWHLPGGTVRFGEKLKEAVGRIAERELGIKIKSSKLLGYIEYPSHYLNGLDSPVGIAFLVEGYDGDIKANDEAKESGWYKQLPANMHDEQKVFIKQNL
jgi:ADP-ribose pyrophosphatase YjhB (NUDIX family)